MLSQVSNELKTTSSTFSQTMGETKEKLRWQIRSNEAIADGWSQGASSSMVWAGFNKSLYIAVNVANEHK